MKEAVEFVTSVTPQEHIREIETNCLSDMKAMCLVQPIVV